MSESADHGDRYVDAQAAVVHAVLRLLLTEHSSNAASPYQDADAEQIDDVLLTAARRLVAAANRDPGR